MRLPLVPGLGLGISDHALPFQCRVKVRSGVPLAVQEPAAHTSLPPPVTAERRLVSVHELGLATCDHVLPFQCSVSVIPGPPGGTPSGCMARHEFLYSVSAGLGWSA